MITKETRGDVIQAKIINDAGLQMRKLAAAQFKAQYSHRYQWVKKLDVELNDVLKEDDQYEEISNN